VHIAGLAADESLVCFHFTGEHIVEGTLMESEADAVSHMPCRLLRDAKIAGNLA